MKTALLLLALVSFTNAVVIKQHLHANPSLRAKLIEEGTLGDVIAQQQLIRAHRGSNDEVTSQPFNHYMDGFYTADIAIGTPYQNFTIIIETASADTWVIDAQRCNSAACKGSDTYERHRFDTYGSSMLKNTTEPFHVSARDGQTEVRGYVITDVFNLAGLEVAKQGLGVASSVGDEFADQPADGVFGLAWPALSDEGVVPPLHNLLDQLDAPIFTMWIDRHVKPDQKKLGGLITYGALDTEHCAEQVDYVVLSSLTYWQFPMTRFSIGKHLSNARQEVIVDSGTAWFGAPAGALSAIVAATGANLDPQHQLYTVKCAAVYPDMHFTIAGKLFIVPYELYVVDAGLGRGICALAIFEQKSDGFGPDWVFGNVWLKAYCNVHDIGQRRIGFAAVL